MLTNLFSITAFAHTPGGGGGGRTTAGQGAGSSRNVGGRARRGNMTTGQDYRNNGYQSAFGRISSVNGIQIRGRGSSNASRAAANASVYSRRGTRLRVRGNQGY